MASKTGPSSPANSHSKHKKRPTEKHESSTIMSKYMSNAQKDDPHYLEKRSRDGAQALLDQLKLDADENCKDMLAELILSLGTQLVKEANELAEHNNRNEILQEDVEYAARQVREHDPDNSYAAQCALGSKLNAMELPKPRNMEDCFRMPLGYCIDQPTFDTRVSVVKAPVVKEEYLAPPPKKSRSEIEISQVTAAFKSDEEDYD
uniref:Transcription initiation factor TFIID subunit 9 n=1 Tax=Panagrellus redivivus TaxID=6233 RepID=A0A7E4ZUH3_PANRE